MDDDWLHVPVFRLGEFVKQPPIWGEINAVPQKFEPAAPGSSNPPDTELEDKLKDETIQALGLNPALLRASP